MNRGGVETWLMQVLRKVDPRALRMDFLVTAADPGHYDSEIRERGSVVIRCSPPRRAARFAADFLEALRQHGPYRAVHSHVHHFSGFVLALACAGGVPVRVAHSHSDTRDLDSGGGVGRRAYLRTMRAGIRRFATHGLAVSEAAAVALFGLGWEADGRWSVVRCGLDFSPYRDAEAGARVRAELGVPSDALVIGHVGRFDECKNQRLLVHVLAAASRRNPGVRLVLVGAGASQERVRAEARLAGVADRVVFAGIRGDVARVLRAFDVFVFPSLREGLPLVGLEAQAAGLPIVISDRVTREVVVLPELFTWKSPADSPESWAEAALEATRRPRGATDAVSAMESSEFGLSRSLPGLLGIYGVPA